MKYLLTLLLLNFEIFNSCGQEPQLSQIFEPPAGMYLYRASCQHLTLHITLHILT